MNIDDLTLGEIKSLKCLFGGKDDKHPYKIGQAYLIRTVTHYYTGRLEQVTAQELVLSNAAWVADTGRYYNAIKDGNLNEVEPILGPAILGRGAVIDAVEWPNNLPDKQK